MDNIAEESESNNRFCTSPSILALDVDAKQNTLPEKSKESYQQAYGRFTTWCKKKNVRNYTEDILLEYFEKQSKQRKSSTLWTTFSKLKASLAYNDNVDMGRFLKLKGFLKRQSHGYQAKQCKTLTREEINKFLVKAPDSKYLMMKIALIMAVTGTCNRSELIGLNVHNIQDVGAAVLVKIVDDKSKLERTFFIANEKDHPIDFVKLYRKYASLRPANANHSRFFLKYAHGKCTPQVVGVHTMAKVPYHIAKYLNLPNPAEYTGHCFRKCSATKLADNTSGLNSQSAYTLFFVPLGLDQPVKEEYINNDETYTDVSDNINETMSNNELPQNAGESEFGSETSDNDFQTNFSTNDFEDVSYNNTIIKEEHCTDKNRINDSKAMYREKKLNYLRRQAVATERLVDGLMQNYQEEKFKLLQREVIAKEKIAAALVDISKKLS